MKDRSDPIRELDLETIQKHLHPRKKLIAIATFIICMLLLAGIIHRISDAKIEHLRDNARLNAEKRALELESSIAECTELTSTLDMVLAEGDGSIDDFPAIASQLMDGKDYIASLQLAPKGVVSEIYPSAGNEAGKIDLFDDPQRGPIVEFSRDTGLITTQGPFDLKQGGQGIAVRNPVYLKKSDGTQEFWGFTVGIIKVPDVFEDSIDTLDSFGYDYQLYKTDPLGDDAQKISGSAKLKGTPETASFKSGESTWTLQVAPKDGWSVSRELFPYEVLGFLIVLLITLLVYLLLIMDEERAMFNELSMTDPLTGLSNRRSFNRHMEELQKSGSPYGIIYMDINGFKPVNNMHGHPVGNEVLREVAFRIRDNIPHEAFRLGGDEFAILISRSVSKAQYDAFYRRILFAFDEPIHCSAGDIPLSLSVGYAMCPEDSGDPVRIREIADARMYVEKEKFRMKK